MHKQYSISRDLNIAFIHVWLQKTLDYSKDFNHNDQKMLRISVLIFPIQYIISEVERQNILLLSLGNISSLYILLSYT